MKLKSKFKTLVLGTPEQRKHKRELKIKEKEAYYEAYERGRIKRAQKEGYHKGRGNTKRRTKTRGKSVLKQVERGISEFGPRFRAVESGATSVLGSLVLGSGSTRQRRKKRKKRR